MIENRALSGGSRLLRVHDPAARVGAPRSSPGQFAMLAAHPTLHLLRRPMSIHDEGDGWRSFMVKPVGPASAEIASIPVGGAIDVSPPFGIGFDLAALSDPLLLVGGGFGVAPLHFAARRLDAGVGPGDYRIFYGGRRRGDVELDVLDGIRGPVLPSTDDGSLGFHGTCVDLTVQELASLGSRASDVTILTCGPHAMMQALVTAVGSSVREIFVSLEEIMACGVGVCMGCVCRTRAGYVPVCTHGPVFRAGDVFGVAPEVDHVEA